MAVSDATNRNAAAAPPPLRELADIARRQARSQPGVVAMVFDGRETTYADLDRATSRVANGLCTLNPFRGTRIALLDKNSDHYYEILLGAAKAGQVLVPVNYRLAPPEMVAIVNDAAATVLFVGEEYISTVERILPELHTVQKVIALSGSQPTWADYRAWRDGHSANDPLIEVNPEDVVVQLYTSGTTGRPKGVLLTHANLVAALGAANEQGHATSRDVNLFCGPQYHIGGITLPCVGFLRGDRNVISRDFNPPEILRLVPAERVTWAAFVPTMLLSLLKTPGSQQADFSSLRCILYGASPIPIDLLRDALARFHCEFIQTYGLTETSGGIAYLPPEDHNPAGTPHMRSCGRPIPGVEVKVVDLQGHELPIGEVGEVVCHSRRNMKGYWNLPNETAKTIRDGWLHTGDAGYFDANGYLYIHDRIKDMIISGAENVYPAEVESALFGHPAVADVGVIGAPDARWGEAVKAIVVRKPGVDVTAEELITFTRTRIAGYKVPKSIDFVESLPRNASGKILKRELRATYWQGRERQVN